MSTQNSLFTIAFGILVIMTDIISAQDIDVQYNLSASAILNQEYNFNLSVNIYPTQNTMSINISGPTDKWFGIGFGSTIMTNTYAIICSKDSNSKSICQENKLGPEGSTGYGEQLTPTINVLQDTTTSNIRRIYLTRNITINNINYFSFSTWTQT
eukprot:988794_1